MLKEDFNKLILTNNIYGRGFVMHMTCHSRDVIERLSIAGDDFLLLRNGWNKVCNSTTYQMFEYVGDNPDFDQVLEACEEIAGLMEMELTLQINPARMPSAEQADPILEKIKELAGELKAAIQSLPKDSPIRHDMMVGMIHIEKAA